MLSTIPGPLVLPLVVVATITRKMQLPDRMDARGTRMRAQGYLFLVILTVARRCRLCCRRGKTLELFSFRFSFFPVDVAILLLLMMAYTCSQCNAEANKRVVGRRC